jgi:Icc-related predicted phosphoesterase
MEDTKLIVYLLSDIHTGDNILYPKKKILVENLIKKTLETKENNIIVLAGDLTHNGYGDADCLCFTCSNTCFSKPNANSSTSDEISKFDKEIYQLLEKANSKILLCHGNHDESTDNMSYPVVDFIKKYNSKFHVTNNGYYYYIENNIVFLVLGKYPSAKALEFFEYVHLLLGAKYPYILIFHYQTAYNSNHDFWTKDEKDAFAKYIDDKNIICILHGHIHFTYNDLLYTIPSNKSVLVFCGSGEYSYAKLTIQNNKCVDFTQMLVSNDN